MQLDASRTSNRAARRSREETGSTLVEVMIATVILATGVLTMAQLFGVATASNSAARANTFATVLAEQKIEQLRSLTWGFDTQGLPISDFATNTTVTPETPNGGTGLTPSPGNALQSNVVGRRRGRRPAGPGFAKRRATWRGSVVRGRSSVVRCSRGRKLHHINRL
jgi:type II secretory pathway pseudopilin PulG